MASHRILTAAALLAGLTAPAHASTVLEGTAALAEWNLIVLGDLQASSNVFGRTFVGGTLSGNSADFLVRTPAASTNGKPGLTVVGNVTGGTKNLNNASGAAVGGNVESGFNLNGTQTVQAGGTIANTNRNQNTLQANLGSSFTNSLVAQRDALSTSLTRLSTELAALAPTGTATIASNRATFNAAPGANGLTVYALTAADLNRFGEIDFRRNGTGAVVVNVSGQTIALNDNFIGNAAQLGTGVLWNFHEATSVNVTANFNGSILAPLARGQITSAIEGTAVFGSLNMGAQMHLGTFSTALPPAVPEPATWAMMIGGFGLVGAAMRRQRRTSVAA